MIRMMIDEKIEKELNRLKVELAMGGYHDGLVFDVDKRKNRRIKKIKG